MKLANVRCVVKPVKLLVRMNNKFDILPFNMFQKF